jgi:hypothetical protein
MARGFSVTLSTGTIALTLACSSVSESDSSYWEPSRDLGGKQFPGFGVPTGGANGAGGSGNSGPGGGSGIGGGGPGGSGQGGSGQGGSGQGGSGQGGGGAVGGMSGTGGGGEGGFGGTDGVGGGGGPGGTGGGGDGPGGTGGGGMGGGGMGGVGGESTTCTLNFDYTTVTYRGRYGPANVGAVWVVDSQKKFMKTIEEWGRIRQNNLINWNTGRAGAAVDIVTTATLRSHGQHHAKWDCKSSAGQIVPNGSYTMFVEFTEEDSAIAFFGRSMVFSFPFEKGAGPKTIMPPNQANFTGMNFTIQ